MAEQELTVRFHTPQILTNTHTLTSASLDTLGISLSLSSARLNHSCTPNTYIVFSKVALSLRTFEHIPADTELTISYIDTTLPTHLRQAELHSRYFFICTCEGCSFLPPPKALQFPTEIIEEISHLLLAARTSQKPAQASEFLTHAVSILESLPPQRPSHVYPYPDVLHEMKHAAIGSQDWALALKYAFRFYHDIDPVQYPLSWHPVRVVHGWVMLRIMTQCATWDIFNEAGGGARIVEWHYVFRKLWKEVMEAVGKSHGDDSALVKEMNFVFPAIVNIAYPSENRSGWKGPFREGVAEEKWAALRKWLDSKESGEVAKEIKEREEKKKRGIMEGENQEEKEREERLERWFGVKKK
ncbi:MAG: hypothetical protein Q9195_001973 [Heterodermia aff. obscurata]